MENSQKTSCQISFNSKTKLNDGKTKKIAIVGCRKFTDYDKFKKCINEWIEENGDVEAIISGGAAGADTLAQRYAKEHTIPITILKPDWSRYGRSAGFKCNAEIVEGCEKMIAFPSKISIGTRDSVSKAKTLSKNVKVFEI